MALRTFRSNPNLGGFGSESTAPQRQHILGTSGNVSEDCDAFAQIIKELVDNAVDACGMSERRDEGKKTKKKTTSDLALPKENKRVRVVIEQFVAATDNPGATGDEKDNENDKNSTEILRVIVSDNGCGMKDIQACVEAFRSSKGSEQDQQKTAGRYGIGLTLCLLHAQRLVPNSCASITSATVESTHFTKAQYVVDAEGDSVRCVEQSLLPKTDPEESGTSVSLLVPVSTFIYSTRRCH